MQTHKQSRHDDQHAIGRARASSLKWFAAERLCALAVWSSLILSPATLQAAITVVGDVTPTYSGSDPWDPYHAIVVGVATDGAISIDGGSVVAYNPHRQRDSYLGYGTGTLGTADVDGVGSLWSVGRHLYIGHEGDGVLGISNGGTVEVYANTWTEHLPGAAGQINFNNGTLDTAGLLASPAELLGVGTINTHAIVSDIDLVFSAANGASQQFILNSLPGQNITINVQHSLSGTGQALGAGYRGVGTTRIEGGLNIQTGYGYIGYHAGSDGTMTVDDSRWYVPGLHVGVYGTGELHVENNGVLESTEAFIAREPGSVGSIELANASWDAGYEINVGGLGQGSLIVRDAGTVETNYLQIGSASGPYSSAQVTGDGSSLRGGFYISVMHGILEVLDGASATTTDTYVGSNAGAEGHLGLSGAGSSLYMSRDLHVGVQGNGSLTIKNGATVDNDDANIGEEGVAIGSVVVGGPGSTWDNRGTVRLSGQSSLRITDGAVVNASSLNAAYSETDNGTLLVDGQDATLNSEWLYVGNTRTLRIENNGTVNVARKTSLNRSDTSQAVIQFNDGTLNTTVLAGSTDQLLGNGTINTEGIYADFDLVFDATHGLQQDFFLNSLPGQSVMMHLDATNQSGYGAIGAGYAGNGTMTVNDGVVLATESGAIGLLAGSNGTVNVTGPGSTWQITNSLGVGSAGQGTLNITNGGTVDAYRAYVGGYETGAAGTVHVSGPDSNLLVSNQITVGMDGDGTLAIDNGASADLGTLHIGAYSSGTGAAAVTVTGQGTRMEVGGVNLGTVAPATLTIDDGAVVNIHGYLALYKQGTLNLYDGVLSIRSKLLGYALPDDPAPGLWDTDSTSPINFLGGRLEVPQLMLLHQPLIQNGGTLALGSSTLTSWFDDGYVLNTGTLELELGGTNNSYDMLMAAGDIDIALTDTTLDLLGIGPMKAGTYTLIQSGGAITGTFEHVTGIAMYPGLVDVTYTTNAVMITLNRDFVPGDLNADGFVGLADLDIVLANWNQSVSAWDLSSGDTDGDGFVGLADLDAVLGNWNQVTPPPAELLANLPGPTTLSLLALGWLTLGLHRCH